MFPKNMLLKYGWIAWLKGFTEHMECTDERTLTWPVKPLRLMNAKLLRKKLCDNSLNEISPMINLMENAEIQINQNTIMDENFIDKSFECKLMLFHAC